MPEIPSDFTDHFGDEHYATEITRSLLIPHCNGKMRRRSIAEDRAAFQEAETQNKPITQEEANMGIRIEQIEGEVRMALRKIWKMGYTTYNSGYFPRWLPDLTKTSDGAHILDFISLTPPPTKILKNIWELTNSTGILTWASVPELEDLETARIFAQRRKMNALSDQFGYGAPLYLWGIGFVYTGGNHQVLKAHWDLIADTLPNLGWTQQVRNTEWAKEFRETHAVII